VQPSWWKAMGREVLLASADCLRGNFNCLDGDFEFVVKPKAPCHDDGRGGSLVRNTRPSMTAASIRLALSDVEITRYVRKLA
jgi:hypothetical protein